MKRIGILNLTRFGDLIQTTPVLSGLRKRFPEAEIHLIVKTRFREVARMLPAVNEIHDIDGDALARVLTDPEADFLDAFRAARDIADELESLHFDAVFNFTHSRASAVMLSLLDADRRIGFDLDRHGFRRVEDPWLRHMSALVLARRVSRYNLVDLYLGAAGLLGSGEPLRVNVPPGGRAFASDRLPGAAPLVAVQLGASQDAKAWSVDHYAKTLSALSRAIPELRVVLLGVPAERELAGELREACPTVRFENLVGETAIAELAGVLERCDVLLTGDTGTMHLAGAVGTATCAVFVGLGNPWETAVYAEGHWALASRIACAPCDHFVKCGFPACHDDIAPDWLAQLVACVLHRRDPDALPALPRADLLRTRFDANGLLDLVPAHCRAPRPFDLMGLAYRAVFLESLAGVPPALEQLWRDADERYGVSAGRWADALPDSIPGELSRLETLAREGEVAALKLAGERAEPSDARRTGALLARCDREVFEIARAQPLLAPLGLSLEAALESLPEGDLATLARRSAREYATLRRRAALVRDIIDSAPREGTAA